MKILIIGANGFLGKKAMKIFSEKNEVLGVSKFGGGGIIKLDLRDKEEIKKIIENFLPEVIFNAASIVDLEFCEKEKATAWEVIVNASLYLSELCKEKNIKFISISSDYIFSGDNSPYYEDSIAHPKSFYGFAKLAMENVIIYTNPEAIIIRPTILYGFNSLNGGDRLVIPIVNLLKEKQEIHINDFRPKYPLLIDDLVRNVQILINKNERGLFNFSGPDQVTRLSMANIIASVFNLDNTLIKQSTPREFKNRPFNVRLTNKRISNLKFTSFEEGVQIIKSQMGGVK